MLKFSNMQMNYLKMSERRKIHKILGQILKNVVKSCMCWQENCTATRIHKKETYIASEIAQVHTFIARNN